MHVSEIALDVTLLIACGMLVVAFRKSPVAEEKPLVLESPIL